MSTIGRRPGFCLAAGESHRVSFANSGIEELIGELCPHGLEFLLPLAHGGGEYDDAFVLADLFVDRFTSERGVGRGTVLFDRHDTITLAFDHGRCVEQHGIFGSRFDAVPPSP